MCQLFFGVIYEMLQRQKHNLFALYAVNAILKSAYHLDGNQLNALQTAFSASSQFAALQPNMHLQFINRKIFIWHAYVHASIY